MSFGRRYLALATGLFLSALLASCATTQKVTFDTQPFDASLERARTSFGGTLLLYYDRPYSALSREIAGTLLADEAVSAYINDHFARYVVDIRSDASRALQQMYGIMGGRTNPELKPAFALISLHKHDVHVMYWERPGEVDPKGFLAWLQEVKERE